MVLKRILLYCVLSLIVAMTIIGGVNATFNYSQARAGDASVITAGRLSAFNYSSNPPDFGEKEANLVEVAISDINDETTTRGYKFAITFSSLPGQSRDKYGYVGSMDKWWCAYIEAPAELSVIMTLPSFDSSGNGSIYLYIAKISKDELNQRTVGEILPQVFRVRLDKNADGVYEQTECKSGKSPVTLYEYAYYMQQPKKINGFAIYGGEVVWTESN